jgi:hypothetical protein
VFLLQPQDGTLKLNALNVRSMDHNRALVRALVEWQELEVSGQSEFQWQPALLVSRHPFRQALRGFRQNALLGQ